MFKQKLTIFLLGILLFNINVVQSKELAKFENKYPDYGYEFLGNDKYENINRKIFNFNTKLNKFIIRPAHIAWASIMPKYGMERIQSAYNNIEYPKRLISSLIQKDFKTSGRETLRFLTNSTIGLGGLYDPAKRFFNLEPYHVGMNQTLASYNVKEGAYLVLPIASSCSTRDLTAKILEAPMDPSLYLGTPITALVKFGLLVNKTAYMQPLSIMLESEYADPYDITRKLYALESYIKNNKLDRTKIEELIIPKETIDTVENNILKEDEELLVDNINSKENQNINNEEKTKTIAIAKNNPVLSNIFNENCINQNNENIQLVQNQDLNLSDLKLKADILLTDFNPQHPVTDAMRTALFDVENVDDSMWSEISLWNRSFSRKIKTGSINIDKNRADYNYRYIMQKDKNAPVVIIYPSIGSGIMSNHSVILAKIFYDAGYSAIIQGSHFHWTFVNSMPKDYCPSLPSQDVPSLRLVTSKIINDLEEKYECKFKDKILIGTSFGAFEALHIAAAEEQDKMLNISKYISISPPIELVYALQEIDKNNEQWNKNPDNLKHRTAVTATKILKLAQMHENGEEIKQLPFTEEESRWITGFLLRQKLSDVILALEADSKIDKNELYKLIHNTSYEDYAKKYILKNCQNIEDIKHETSLHSIKDFLKNNNNYVIYQSLNDYLINTKQLKELKSYAGNNLLIIDNGSHLGFLYRDEFINNLKTQIYLSNKRVTMQNTDTQIVKNEEILLY